MDELRLFNYVIIYRKGEEQQAADFLSQNAIESAEEGDVRPPDFRNPIDQINDTSKISLVCVKYHSNLP